MVVDWGDDERRLTSTVSVLGGPSNGAYPSGNSLLVRGSGETVLIDPSVTVVERGGAPAPVDAVINSHSHEDHMAGNGVVRRRPAAHPRRRPPRCAEHRRPARRVRPRRPDPRRLHVDAVRGVQLRAAARRRGVPRRPRLRPRWRRRSRRCTCPATPVGTAGSGSRTACSSCPTSISPGSARTTATRGAISTTSRRACGGFATRRPTSTSRSTTRV